ncbi:hypothetical protein SAMN05421767_1064 [Granulicatella balaenopterae]|uniref:Uncharacterized protein n=1 Tax=Granulicatella balaenopterae TaxID=137733 RepID=A0A1H9IJ86_9LACT|nr:hypothetical protein [Granulicatella balaenopterae]SEQ74618.1 hypothetical protein SAMN05421767_1064 [Granulicatella balaenopterae]
MVSKKLTRTNNESRKGSPLTNRNEVPFKIALTGELANGFEFIDLNKSKPFHDFIKKTVYKNLTVSKVENLFLRTKGKVKETEFVHGEERDIIHFGENKKAFRIFGYYNQDGYFVIYKIDPKHKTHKQ